MDFRTFDSRAASARVSFHIYAPEAYSREQERRFPVLYWLHGSGGGLRGIPQLARHFDSAIAAGKLVSEDAPLKNLVKSKLGMNRGGAGNKPSAAERE